MLFYLPRCRCRPVSGGSEADYERFRDDRLIPALRSLDRALQVIEARPATETVRILHVA